MSHHATCHWTDYVRRKSCLESRVQMEATTGTAGWPSEVTPHSWHHRVLQAHAWAEPTITINRQTRSAPVNYNWDENIMLPSWVIGVGGGERANDKVKSIYSFSFFCFVVLQTHACISFKHCLRQVLLSNTATFHGGLSAGMTSGNA